MIRDLTWFDLKAAFRQEGCPICHCATEAELAYLRSLLWESVTCPYFREQFIAARGFCPTHTALLFAVEGALWGARTGMAMFAEHLLAVIIDDLLKMRVPRSRPQRRWSSVAGPGGHWLRRLGRWLLSNLVQPGGIRPPEPVSRCPLCVVREETVERYCAWLGRYFADSEVQAAYRESGGLCREHLEATLACCSNPAAGRTLLDHTISRLSTLRQELREYVRKSAWQFRDEPRGAEQASPQRALAFLAGQPWLKVNPDLLRL